MISKKNIIFVNLLLIVFSLTTLNAVTKKAEEVFKKWFEWQRIYPDCNMEGLKTNLSDKYVDTFRKHYEKYLPHLRKTHLHFLKVLTNNQINEYGYQFNQTFDETFKKNLVVMYDSVERDMLGFLNHLCALSINQPMADREFGDDTSTERNIALASLLFASENPEQEISQLFSVANRFFRFCFKEETFPLFENILLTKDFYPLARFLYTTMWYNLAGTGWKNWSLESLQAIKQEADQGKTITYIAGGSDLYQLIKHGIYKIRNIDPQLPSQPKYYADDWAWILKGDGPQGGVGDQILFDFGARKITMQRVSFQESNQAFKARLADGQIVTIPVSKTVWSLTDQDGKQVGSYTLERRFVQQEDFVTAPDKAFLMSFNELFFIALPDFLNGWHIEPNKFSDDFKINIKQLSQPVNKKMICNMRIASLLNNTDFRFISLGTCIN